MYTIELRVGDETVSRHTIIDDAEQCWIAAGLDILPLQGWPAIQLEQDAWYAQQNLKASPDYYEQVHPEHYVDVLHFLDRVIEGCQDWPEAQVEVTY